VSPYATDSFSIASIKFQEPRTKFQEPRTETLHGVLGIWFLGMGFWNLVLPLKLPRPPGPVQGTPGSLSDLFGLLLQYLRRGSGPRQGRLPAGRSGERKSCHAR